jgi:hypothetical protein
VTEVTKCGFCKPHADPRRQRLCHEGTKLLEALRETGVRYINLCGQMEPPAGSVELAREERAKAREAFNAHTGGGI